jgi:DNA-directed RNA polymerase subunit beta'
VRIREFDKSADGEYSWKENDPSSNDRGSCAVVRDSAEGIALQRSRQAAEEEGNLQADQRFVPSCGLKETVVFADKLMQNGYAWRRVPASPSASDDMLVPTQEARDHCSLRERKLRKSRPSTPTVW